MSLEWEQLSINQKEKLMFSVILKVTPVSVQERRGSITANSKKKGRKYFIETKRLYLELTVSKKSNINLHILPWALCWLAAIGAGPKNQKEHYNQHHNKTNTKWKKQMLKSSPGLLPIIARLPLGRSVRARWFLSIRTSPTSSSSVVCH